MHGVQYNSRIVQSFPCHMELQLQVSGRTQVPLFSHVILQMAGVYHTTCQAHTAKGTDCQHVLR